MSAYPSFLHAGARLVIPSPERREGHHHRVH
jgi:hypothetical protein